MRILHIITGLPTAGAQTALYRLLANTNPRKFDSIVLSLMDRGVIGKMIEELGVPVYSLGLRRGVPQLSDIRRFIYLVQNIPVPDVIQGWEYHGNIASVVASYLFPVRPLVFWNIRHTPARLGDEKLLTALIIHLGRLISKRVNTIIYNSDISRSVHENLGYEKSSSAVLYNGFDLDQFSPSLEKRHFVRNELGIDQEIPLIALIARFHPMKDHATFLSAARLLLHEHPNIRFLLSGENIDIRNTYLYDLVVRNGLIDNVFLLGERHDIPRLLAAVDIVVLTSAWGEGFPNILGEAMASGVPCVATDVGDSAKIIGKTGFIVARRDAVATFNALNKLLLMPMGQRNVLGFAARKRIEENYSIIKMIKSYEYLYSKSSINLTNVRG